MMATNTRSLLLLYVHDNPAIMTAMHASLLLPYVCNDPAIMTATHTKLILALQLIVVFSQGVLTAQHNSHGTLSISEGVRAPTINFNDSEISLYFCEDCGIFCEGEWEVKDDGNTIVKKQSAYISNACTNLLSNDDTIVQDSDNTLGLMSC
jgi:hypothetical protein